MPASAVTRAPSLVFQEPGQAFVDVNSSFVLRLNLGSACFPMRFLIEPMGLLGKVLSNLRRNLALRHLVNGLDRCDVSTESAFLDAFLQLTFGLTRTKYQNGFRITHAGNDRIIENVEMSREGSQAAIIRGYQTGFIGALER